MVEDLGVDVEGHRIHVRSIAGVQSSCYVEAVDVVFDIGCCFGKSFTKSHVFITHGHIDHIASFVSHAARRRLQGLKPATYYVPVHLVGHMKGILEGYSAMQESPIEAKIIPLQPHQEIHIDAKWVVRSFPTCHVVPSLGFLLYRKVPKLRADLVGLDGREIAARKRAGEAVTELTIIPEIAYTGDTTIDVFDRAEAGGYGDLLRVRVLITEATYVDDKMTAADAISRGHIHLGQIIATASNFSLVGRLLLVHSSARYGTEEELQELVHSRLPPSLAAKTLVAGR